MSTNFPAHPWFGQGLRYVESATHRAFEYIWAPELFFVDKQLLHSGFFSSLDYVGIVGTCALAALSLRGFYNCYILLGRHRRQLTPWMVWVIAYFMARQCTFWVTGFFDVSFMPLSICAAVIEVSRTQLSPSQLLHGHTPARAKTTGGAGRATRASESSSE